MLETKNPPSWYQTGGERWDYYLGVCVYKSSGVRDSQKKSSLSISLKTTSLEDEGCWTKKALFLWGQFFGGLVGVGGLGRRVPSHIHERGRRNWEGRQCNQKVKEYIRLVFLLPPYHFLTPGTFLNSSLKTHLFATHPFPNVVRLKFKSRKIPWHTLASRIYQTLLNIKNPHLFS